MKKWQKLGMVGACISTVMMTAGCLPDSGKSGGDSAKTENGKTEANINFSWWGNDDRHQATQNAIDAFNAAHEGEITVKGEPSGFGNLDETFATR